MASILIKNGRVWDGERFFYADVLTDGDKISKIEQGIDEPADFVYDAEGKIVSAGLVDAHVHMRGISVDKYGVQAEMSCLPFGVTAAVDAGGGYGDRALLESFLVKNVQLVGVSIRDNRMDVERTEAKIAKYGDKVVGLKIYFDVNVSQVTDTTPLREACDYAHARGWRVMVHCSHSPTAMAEILATLGEGDILTHAFHGGENNASLDGYESMRAAQARGVIIDVGMAGHVHTDFGVLRGALERGIVPDVISTDITKNSAYTRGGRYGLTLCMSVLRAFGMKEEDVFRAVTSAPARAMGKGDEWGDLRVGRQADLAVLALADEGFDMTDKAGNRAYGEEGYRCVLTVADGRVIYRR